MTDSPNEADEAFIVAQTQAYNAAFTQKDVRRLCVFVRDTDGSIIGGLTGKTYWHYLEVAFLWVSEQHRQAGHASRILHAAESEARRRGCKHALLDTYSFQALGFYQKNGYKEFGLLTGFGGKHDRHYLHKEFDATAPNFRFDLDGDQALVMERENQAGASFTVSPELQLLRIGGRTRTELLEDLHSGGIKLNEHAKTLLTSSKLQTCEKPRWIRVAVVSVRDLGFPHGADIQAIQKRALEGGLSLCPMELAPHFRLQYQDQPEGFLDHPATQQKAPPGSITVACEPIDLDDQFPKGFYLRRIEGVLWLRGYCSDNEHVWDPGDQFAFCEP